MSTRPQARTAVSTIALSALWARHAVAIGNGLTTPPANLLRDGVCRPAVRAVARHRATRIVDNDARTARSKQQGILLAQAPTGAGDHGYPLVEP